jgi:hypothetical protein
MVPPAARDDNKPTTSSSPRSGPKRTKKKRHHLQNTEESLPGVQKIKSSLRQTRRLLAKESLAADVRVETERRLKALETDLARAETARKERTYAMKYHKVKFFGEFRRYATLSAAISAKSARNWSVGSSKSNAILRRHKERKETSWKAN